MCHVFWTKPVGNADSIGDYGPRYCVFSLLVSHDTYPGNEFCNSFQRTLWTQFKSAWILPLGGGAFHIHSRSYKSIILVRGFTHNFTLVPYEEALGGSFIRNHLYQIYGNKEQIFAENVEHY